MGSGVMLSGAAALVEPRFDVPAPAWLRQPHDLAESDPAPEASIATRHAPTSSDRLAADQPRRPTSGPSAIATATAAVEIAAGVWGRALSIAIVSPRTARTRAITPSLLELAGRAMARRGEVVFDLEVDAGGALALLPCAAFNVLIGSPDQATWIYALQLLRAQFHGHTLPPP